jgi:hypothetical protein
MMKGTIEMAMSVLELMDEQIKKAKESPAGGSYKPTFLLLKNGHKALIRPLFNLDAVVVMSMHNKFNQAEPKQSINATCARELDKKCKYCDQVASDKKLAAGVSFMLPVFVYGITDGEGKPVTYKDADGQEVAVSGIRILELKSFGAISTVLSWLREYFAECRKDDETYSLTSQDFSITRVGEGQKTDYTVLAKAPKPFTRNVSAITAERVRERVIEACPPVVLEDASATAVVENAKNNHHGAALEVPEF